jgi:hypothetical protein
MALSEHEGIGIVSGQHAAYRDAICNPIKLPRTSHSLPLEELSITNWDLGRCE